MSYITKAMIKSALGRMKIFENELFNVFNKHGYCLRKNLGRRNALVSESQEHEIAESLRTVFKSVIEDGTPGKPDIVIHDLDRELECKLTSGHGKGRVISFQTDWATLQRKGMIDYIYMIASEEFDKFCVIYFDGLTCDDFHLPANGSRGKSRMNKKVAMKKSTVLHGSCDQVNDQMIINYKSKIKKATDDCNDEISLKLIKLLERNADTDEAKRLVDNIEARYEKKIKVYNEKIKHWEQKDPRYSFTLSKC